MWRVVLAGILISVLAMPQQAKAEPMRELIMSSAYGVLAGTLVGAATLAFTERPGDNLRNIARGASLGLYAGILLGLYVIYVIPGEGDDEGDDGYPPEEQGGVSLVYPIIGETNSVEGAGVTLRVFSF